MKYRSVKDCMESGEHLQICDNDGYCCACGHQPEDPNSEHTVCSKCRGEKDAEGWCANYCTDDDLSVPPPGSWASVARMMAQYDDSGFDWDAWKDEMKEREYSCADEVEAWERV